MKKYILPICIFVLLTCKLATAQVNLSVSFATGSSLSSGDSTVLGSTQNFNVWIKNTGTITFTPSFVNPLTIYTAVRDTANAFILNIVDTDTTHALDSIPAGDSLFVSLNETLTNSSAGYHRDINVIVIWPYASAISSIDSLEFPVFLMDPNGINEIDINTIISVFPNPTTDYLSLENKSKFDIEEVRIVDTSGKLLSVLQKPTKIETKSWPQGMYLIHILLGNKQSKTIRIIKR